ncbi:hypothetical protein, partial [Streptomyces sp. NPDC005209]|uniref:hypothetical protein n=1 Tax=Streptomyces sp. NPDC005209 TaxID=3156715 RepID=UPI0033A4DB00
SVTYRQLADRPGRTELRRRLYRLSTQVFFHPYWQQSRPSPAGWWELRSLGLPDPGSSWAGSSLDLPAGSPRLLPPTEH